MADVGTVYVTALGGAIDPWMLIALHRRITDALDAGDDRVVLDLSAVTVLGGVTVGVLCGVLRRLALGGGSGLLPDLLPEGTASADPLFPDGRTGSCLPP